jgi:hypothetical protein
MTAKLEAGIQLSLLGVTIKQLNKSNDSALSCSIHPLYPPSFELYDGFVLQTKLPKSNPVFQITSMFSLTGDKLIYEG